MPTISCKLCGKDFELAAGMTQCPHCNKAIADDVLSTVQVEHPAEDEDAHIKATGDTAKTAVAGTMQSPLRDEEIIDLADSAKTVGSAGRSPNFADYSATLKPTDSAFESVDLSSAIPPRAISRKDEKPGEAQDYRLREKLGSGSFGVVYRAEQVPLERTVALKMLKPRKRPSDKESLETKARIKSQRVKDRNEFLREAQFTGKLEHPNIVPVHDIGLVKGKNGTGNRPFYVMKEIKGDSWQSKLKHNTRAENLDILRRVADAIEFSHDKNIIHCDLKPENVMLGEFGEVLVVDWGGAVDLGRRETYRPGGSPAYISPEMATYWCHIYLDKKETSTASKEIGKHSDVYLLGAMLFEIVTGSPPHFGLKGEDAYDVMRRATENQIRKHDKWMEDELMQIARKALRLDESGTYNTVHDFQDALREYESQRLSIELRDRAEELLTVAKETKDYDAYGKSRFGFEESIEKWDGNLQAKSGLRDARLSCADLALADQNFDLGIGMLEEPETKEEKTLKDKLISGKRNRDRRKRLVQLLSIGFALAIVIGTITALILTKQARDERAIANKAKGEAKVAEAKAAEDREAADIAIFQADEAKRETARLEIVQNNLNDKIADIGTELEEQQDEVQKQTELAAEKTELAAEKTRYAKVQTDLANAAAADARVQALKAERARETYKLLGTKDAIVQVRSSIVDGDYSTANDQLANAEDKSAWEWSRLNMRTHPEAIDFLPETSKVIDAAASEDGSKIVLVKANEVAVHDSKDFNKLIREPVPVNGATVAAISPDGRVLAIGIPGINDEVGRIEIHAGDDTIVLDEAPSDKITDLQFSHDGQQLVCVGTPSPSRKSQGIEKELMIYRRGSERWQRTEVVKREDEEGEDTFIRPSTYPVNPNERLFGTQPKFDSATFSEDGLRVLLSNTDEKAQDKSIHVLEDNGQAFIWIAGTSEKDIDAAVFADREGKNVVGGRTTISSSVLFSWSVDASGMGSQSPTDEFGNQYIGVAVSELETLARLQGRVRTVKRNGSLVLTGGDDNRVSLWNLEKGDSSRSFPGHSRAVDFCTFIKGVDSEKPTLISVAKGANPEILRTNLADYQADVEELLAGDEESKENSPFTIFRSQIANKVAIGSDHGSAIVKIDDDIAEWEVSAWTSHTLSKDFLFAQTSYDNFLRYDRKTGAIGTVLSLKQAAKIIKFQVSDDGRIGLVETDDTDAKEFQIWDLENQKLIKNISFGQLFSPNREKNELPTVALSPGGDYVVGGKVGFAVWSTEPGVDEPIFKKIGASRGALWPNATINNIVFLDGGNEFLLSWPQAASKRRASAETDLRRRTGRLHLYKKQDQSVELRGRFRHNITLGGFDTNLRAYEPNMFDAKMIKGQRYVLVRTSGTIDLLRLKPGQADLDLGREWDAYDKVTSYDRAKFASFSDQGNHILILNKGTTDQLQKWNLESQTFETIAIGDSLKNNFGEFPANNFDSILEAADGTLTIKTSTRRNARQRDYNTVSLNEDLSIGALRVCTKPTVKYSTVVGNRAITLECGTIRYWDLVRPEGRWLVRPAGVLPGFYDLCQLSPNENQLLVKERSSGRIRTVNPLTGDELYAVDGDVPFPATAAIWSKDSNEIVVGFENGCIRVLNVEQGRAILAADPPSPGTKPVRSLAFSEDGTSLLAIFEGELARVYRAAKEEKGWTSISIGYSDRDDEIVAGDISADGNRVITGSSLGHLTVWNAESTVSLQDPEGTDVEIQQNEQLEQRELFDLVGDKNHKSAISLVRFFANPENNDRIDVISAETQGGNKLLIWKTNNESEVKFLPNP